MKYKKLLSILLITAMILSFTACARQTEPDTQNENSTQEEQSEQTQQSDESQTKPNPPATEQNSDSNPPKLQKENKNPIEKENHTNEDEPTEEELLELFERAMNDIFHLSTDDIPTLLSLDIFDRDIEFFYSDQVTINDIPYERTSRKYSELVDYYSQTFTGEPLEWILNSRFADVDGVLYCFPYGGATGFGTKAVSIEKLEENTYQATYENSYIDGSTYKNSTTFSIQKIDAGYRISGIDYPLYRLDPEELKVD